MSTYESPQTITEALPRYVSWIAAFLFVILALGTYTMSPSGGLLRQNAATVGYIALAALAIPQVRTRLDRWFGVDLDRWMVVGVLLAGFLVVDGFVAPPTEGGMLP